MTLTFIGHGYVGLVTAAIFADLGNTVWVIGRSPDKIEALKRGETPFYEPGLAELVKRNVDARRLLFTLDYEEPINASTVTFICVGTPPQDDGSADLSQVFAVAKKIGQSIKNDSYRVVITKSTVPPGTNRKVASIVRESMDPSYKNKEEIIDIASCPEFLREGTALNDTLHPDRIVIGTDTEKAKKVLVDLHKPIGRRIVLTSVETAEMIKYVANSILSTKISFANAVAFLCEKVGADVEKVMDGVGLDRRIGRSFLYPGVGYGGSCFPKDVKALVAFAKEVGYDFKLLKSVDEINKEAMHHFVQKVVDTVGDKSQKQPLKGKTIGILGLSFKPDTDDLREAPSLCIIDRLKAHGATIRAYDPVAMEKATKIVPDISYTKDAYECASGADALLIITEWNEFRQLDLKRIKKTMNTAIIIDGRNIYEPEKMRKIGFIYQSVGRPIIS